MGGLTFEQTHEKQVIKQNISLELNRHVNLIL